MGNEKDFRPSWDQGIYRTGSTTPPKTHGALIAILLVVVIILCSLVSLLSLLNIQLFRKLKSQQGYILSLSQPDSTGHTTATNPRSTEPLHWDLSELGLTVEAVSTYHQTFYDLPAGLYVTAVAKDSPAALAGLQLGDILLSPDGQTLTGEALLANESILVYRSGKTWTVRLIVP